MGEDKATRWRRLTQDPRDRLMAAVAAIHTGLDEFAGEVLAEALRPKHSDFLHPQDRQALQREQRRRTGEKLTRRTR